MELVHRGEAILVDTGAKLARLIEALRSAGTLDAAEGVRSFIERRKAHFVGQ